MFVRNSTLPQTIPSWTGFNSVLRKDIPVSKGLVGYLDCLDAPATDNATTYHLLCRSLMIKEKLGLSSMICVYDQAMFPKAIKIQFKEKEKFKSLVLMMGGFHTLMMFLGFIGTHFKDAGLQDILIQGGVLAGGSAERVMTGSMYNHFVRMCRLMYEAFTRMLITKMERNIESIEEVYGMLPSDWNNESCYHEFVNSDETKKYIMAFYDYKSKLSQQCSLAAFWISYLDMVTVLLNFIYSFRAGKLYLYLESI